MLAAGARDVYAIPDGRLRYRCDGCESLRTDFGLILRLSEEWQVFGQKFGGGRIPVIAVSVGDQHNLNLPHKLLRTHGQRNQRIVEWIGRVLNGRTGAGVVEHGIDQNSVAGVLKNQRGMSDQAYA